MQNLTPVTLLLQLLSTPYRGSEVEQAANSGNNHIKFILGVFRAKHQICFPSP